MANETGNSKHYTVLDVCQGILPFFSELSSGIVGLGIRLVGLLELFYGFPGYFTGFRVVTGFRVILRDSGFVLRDGSTGAGLGTGLIDLCRFEYQYREAMR
jgi:hypothetical protein